MTRNQGDFVGRDPVDDVPAAFGEYTRLVAMCENLAETQLVARGTANRRGERIVQRDGLLEQRQQPRSAPDEHRVSSAPCEPRALVLSSDHMDRDIRRLAEAVV